MGVWLGVMVLAAPPRGVNPPDLSPQARQKADSVHFAWRVHYYEHIIPWNRPNPILQHPQIQQCLGYTLQNGRVVFPKTVSHERLANRLEIVYTSFFFPAYVLVKCGFLPSYLTLYLRHVREFIPLTEARRSVLLNTLWFNMATASGFVILKNVKRRWVMPWEKAWKAGYRSVFIGEIVETILPPDTFLGRLDRDGKVRLWSEMGPFDGMTVAGGDENRACKVPKASPMMLIAYIPFTLEPRKHLEDLPGAIRSAATYRLEVVGADTLVIRGCDYLEPQEIWISNTEKRVIRHESDTTRMAVVRRMVAELMGWVQKL